MSNCAKAKRIINHQAILGRYYRSYIYRVAAYCRISTEKEEQLNSLKTQTEYYNSYISKNPNWKLVGIFADKSSAKNIAKRPAFNKMMELCRAGQIDCILTKSIKRFSRNTVDTLNICNELKGLGIEVIFELEKIKLSELDSMLALTVYSSFAQNEIENLSQDTKIGIRFAFQSGTSKYLSRPCYGYRRKNGKLVIDQSEAAIVRRIFGLKVGGCSINQIRAYLEKNSVSAPRNGRKWSNNTIYHILHNEKYVGKVILGKTYVANLFDGRQRKNDGQSVRYIASENHPAIIARVTYDKCNR